MTTTTEDGLDSIASAIAGSVSHLAVGSGQNESTTATELGNQEFVANISTSIVEILQPGPSGEIEAVIAIKGGTELPAGTILSEIGVFDGDPTTQNATLLFIDEFSSVEIEAGHTQEFTVPIDARRI